MVLAAFRSFNLSTASAPESIQVLNTPHDTCCRSVNPVSVVLRGRTQPVRTRVRAHGCCRDYRRVTSRCERDPRAASPHQTEIRFLQRTRGNALQWSSSPLLSPAMQSQFGVQNRRRGCERPWPKRKPATALSGEVVEAETSCFKVSRDIAEGKDLECTNSPGTGETKTQRIF